MNAPDWFVKELAAFDPDLRLRWSTRLEAWQIERRVRRSLHPGTVLTDGYRDDYIRARDGYLLVATVPPLGLGRHIFDRLRDSDLWARGGWQRVSDQLEEMEEVEESQRWQKFKDDIRDHTKDLYDLLKLRDGRSVYSAGWIG